MEGSTKEFVEAPAVADITPGHKGLKPGALGYVSNLVIASASTAPAYSPAATLGFIVAVGGVGVHAPAVLIVSVIPILFVSVGYRFFNLADPNRADDLDLLPRDRTVGTGPWPDPPTLPHSLLLHTADGRLSIVWTIALLAFNPNQDVLGDTISALGSAVCFYYGFTGLACAVYFRHDLFKIARNFVFAGLIPVIGGIMMRYVAVKACSYYNTAGNNYSKPFIEIEIPIFVGIGGLILGIILMFASRPFSHGFFNRKWLEAADPAVLEADAHYRANPVVPD